MAAPFHYLLAFVVGPDARLNTGFHLQEGILFRGLASPRLLHA